MTRPCPTSNRRVYFTLQINTRSLVFRRSANLSLHLHTAPSSILHRNTNSSFCFNTAPSHILRSTQYASNVSDTLHLGPLKGVPTLGGSVTSLAYCGLDLLDLRLYITVSTTRRRVIGPMANEISAAATSNNTPTKRTANAPEKKYKCSYCSRYNNYHATQFTPLT